MAVRLALRVPTPSGAALLTESVLLSSCGATGCCWRPQQFELYSSLACGSAARFALTIDLRVLAFTALISLTTEFSAAFVPDTAGEAKDLLKQSERRVGGVQSRLRNSLVVAQIAIALVLLTGAGLMAKSFWNLVHVSPGFRTEHILIARVSLPGSRYPDVQRIAIFQSEVLERVRNLPGIQAAGLTAYRLSVELTTAGPSLSKDGRPCQPAPATWRIIARECRVPETIEFRWSGARVHNRRWESASRVVVINESMARIH
jgi:hypothetical protein